MHCVEAMKKVQSHSIAITRRNLATLPAQGDRSRAGESCRSQGRSARPLPELADARNEGIAGRHAHVATAGVAIRVASSYPRGYRSEAFVAHVAIDRRHEVAGHRSTPGGRAAISYPRGYRSVPQGRVARSRGASLDPMYRVASSYPRGYRGEASWPRGYRSARRGRWASLDARWSRRELIPTWVSLGVTRSRREQVAWRQHAVGRPRGCAVDCVDGRDTPPRWTNARPPTRLTTSHRGRRERERSVGDQR